MDPSRSARGERGFGEPEKEKRPAEKEKRLRGSLSPAQKRHSDRRRRKGIVVRE